MPGGRRDGVGWVGAPYSESLARLLLLLGDTVTPAVDGIPDVDELRKELARLAESILARYDDPSGPEDTLAGGAEPTISQT